jgi:hypothetical protein
MYTRFRKDGILYAEKPGNFCELQSSRGARFAAYVMSYVSHRFHKIKREIKYEIYSYSRCSQNRIKSTSCFI